MDEVTLKKLETCSDSVVNDTLIEFNNKHSRSFSFPELGLPLKKQFVSLLFKQLSSCKTDHIVYLESLRILSRENSNIEELFSKQNISLLLKLAGLSTEEAEIINQSYKDCDTKVMVEGLKCLCNLIYNSTFVQQACCNLGCIESVLLRLRAFKDPDLPHLIKFFDMRLLFLMTALCAEMRPKVRSQLHGLTYLMEVLDLILKDNVEQMSHQTYDTENRRRFNKSSKRGRGNQNEVESCFAPCLTDQEVEMSCEVLKVLFNLSVNLEKNNLEEEEESHYMRLVSILHDILLSDAKSPEKKEELQSHTINLLITMPMSSYEELLTPVLNASNSPDAVEFEGMNMDAVCVLLDFLEKRLIKHNKTYKEVLSPILTTLCECARSQRIIRRFLRQKVLPPLREDDVLHRPEDGDTLRNRLVKLMTSPNFDVKELVADFLFVLCKENVNRLVKYTGYGNAAGMLSNRGLMLGENSNREQYSSDSEDSDTEEYLKYKDKINPILGCFREPGPNPLEGMSEEQKEYEAMQLVNVIDKLSRNGLAQPLMLGEDGKPFPCGDVLILRQNNHECSKTDSD